MTSSRGFAKAKTSKYFCRGCAGAAFQEDVFVDHGGPGGIRVLEFAVAVPAALARVEGRRRTAAEEEGEPPWVRLRDCLHER